VTCARVSDVRGAPRRERVPRFSPLANSSASGQRAEASPPLPAQVKHLVSVETAQQRTERLAALEKKLAWRPPIEVKH